MLKVIVFDSGYGGELFADQLERELPILNIIRVIDWRHANELQNNPKDARKIAATALRPYIGRVDLIVFANLLLATTSLKYFQRKYKDQRFIGLKLKQPTSPTTSQTLILTTKAITKTVSYYNYLFRLRRSTKTLALDTWPAKIDDGELTKSEIKDTLLGSIKHNPQEVILACSQFSDITPILKNIFGRNLRIYDGFNDAIREVCKTLKIRGSLKKLK